MEHLLPVEFRWLEKNLKKNQMREGASLTGFVLFSDGVFLKPKLASNLECWDLLVQK